MEILVPSVNGSQKVLMYIKMLPAIYSFIYFLTCSFMGQLIVECLLRARNIVVYKHALFLLSWCLQKEVRTTIKSPCEES